MEGPPPDFERLFDSLAGRADLLAALADGPMAVRDVRDELGCSRSTAYKAVGELEALDLVERGESGYRPTLLGRLAFRRYRRFASATADLLELEGVFSTLPPDLPVDPAVFADARVVVADSRVPDRPVDALEAFVAEADSLRIFTPVTRSRYVAYGVELVRTGDVAIELLTEREIIEYLIANHRDEVRRILESGQVTYYQTAESLPFGLIVADDPDRRVGLALYDEHTQLRAFVAADRPAAYAWADDAFESHREGATRVTVERRRERPTADDPRATDSDADDPGATDSGADASSNGRRDPC
ncbi:MAG: helix-turn-helix transcriptional regulator [Salinigranum sp.]